MIAIASVDKNFGIGYNNKLLFRIPEDMKFFKETTLKSIVVMGRNTFESLGLRPLPERSNFIVTSRDDLDDRDDILSGTIEEINVGIFLYSPTEDVYIIGGESIYNYYIDKCDELLLTQYDREYDDVDAYFPNPEEHGFYFKETISSGEYEGHQFSINRWTKK